MHVASCRRVLQNFNRPDGLDKSGANEVMSEHSTSTLHQDVFLLLPWYVNGSLEAGEVHKVIAHVGECETCRREIEFLTHMGNATADDDNVQVIARNGYARLVERIDAADTARKGMSAPNNPIGTWFKRFTQSLGPYGYAVSAAMAAVVIALMVWFVPGDDPAYRTLSSDDPAAEVVAFRVVLTDDSALSTVIEQIGGSPETTVTVSRSTDSDYLFTLPKEASTKTITAVFESLKGNANVKTVEMYME